MSNENPQPPGNPGTDAFLKLLATILKEIGIMNFLVLFGAIFLWAFASDIQKERFIDTWFLLDSDKHTYCVIIIAGILGLSFIGWIYFKTMLKLSRTENERVGKEKSQLQAKMLNKELNSSE
ncbi:MAG TPA: hypothetical protein VK508_01660 [Cyclobacteriaceae bacterium]|nr:hypothetical protein [Cyclobacteriaceae bacterium]